MIDTCVRNGVFPFYAEDMISILNDGIKEFGLDSLTPEAITELAELRQSNGQCVSGWVDGKVMGCGGIDLMWEGVGEVWLMLSPDIDSYSLKTRMNAYKTISEGLEELIQNNNLIRCQAWGRVGFHRSHTLFKHLGFTPEGVAEKYMPDGEDAILYARIRRQNG